MVWVHLETGYRVLNLENESNKQTHTHTHTGFLGCLEIGSNNQQIGHIVRFLYVMTDILDIFPNLMDYLSNMYT